GPAGSTKKEFSYVPTVKAQDLDHLLKKKHFHIQFYYRNLREYEKEKSRVRLKEKIG
ncbi:9109_t:CDS:1, partial [Gigaspora margarita]